MKTSEHEDATGGGTRNAKAMTAPTTRVKVSDKDELPVWVAGEGPPVVMVHGALMRSFFQPVIDGLAEKGGYQLIWYNRRGYNGAPTEPVDTTDHAPDIIKILDALQIGKAHVVGHSYGANIALELAMRAPDRLLSAVLLEPSMVQQVASGKAVGEGMAPAMAKVESGDLEGASVDFLAAIGGSRRVLEEAMPGSWAHVVKDSSTWFHNEAPTLMTWEVDPARAKAIKTPLALGAGANELPNIAEARELLQEWQPAMHILQISGAEDHMFPVKQAAETAAAIDHWLKSQGATTT